MIRSAVVSPKIAAKATEVTRQVKETRALIRAADRALIRHAKKTRTVFIGTERGDDEQSSER
jgi:hypothetical protein